MSGGDIGKTLEVGGVGGKVKVKQSKKRYSYIVPCNTNCIVTLPSFPCFMQIILVTHSRTGDLRESLKYIYNLYVEYVVKNPLYTPGSPIRSELFNTTLDQYVRGIA
ncbi:hypothetical protein TSUD_270890 [Trifolium subterraneum]|uniref:Trafficking protein particle complex subunit n=1 Tax=Trifolium subterraneum TaxID=3900 RepID=A0A2Z6MH62_TRISU|nr:hypothetical protein TSUD_270890 [Trifolium subterraneum]